MKKIKLIIILCSIFLITGCGVKTNNLDNAKIYTTIYPVEYIVNYLYGDNSTIESIYPVGVDLDTYELTQKQIETYSSGDLFVYVGIGREKEFAKSFINKNKNLLIIDATYGFSNPEHIEELWLATNNFLMLAKNIKNSLNEYLDNAIKEEAVNNKYDELYEKVSWIDAELRNVSKEAKENGNNTIVASSNTLKFLENYGFNVISLEEISNSGSENAINDIKNKFKNSEYTTILKIDTEVNSDLVNEITEKYQAGIEKLKGLVKNEDTASDYITLQYENISTIRNILIK